VLIHLPVADVNHNMHDRPMRGVMEDMDVHDMKVEPVEGDGEQDIWFFKHKVKAVLLELLADKRREGC
jgi:hypothetical protein